jgi:hypothetical protein
MKETVTEQQMIEKSRIERGRRMCARNAKPGIGLGLVCPKSPSPSHQLVGFSC